MPEPLRTWLGTAHATDLFAELAGRTAGEARQECETSPAGRLPLLLLAAVITSYEQEISGDATRRNTWRLDQYAPCPRGEAGAYLDFLASLGYQLSAIEQAVADGVPYTGDNPPADLLPALDPDDPPSEPGEAVPSEQDAAGEAQPVSPASEPEESTGPAQAAA